MKRTGKYVSSGVILTTSLVGFLNVPQVQVAAKDKDGWFEGILKWAIEVAVKYGIPVYTVLHFLVKYCIFPGTMNFDLSRDYTEAIKSLNDEGFGTYKFVEHNGVSMLYAESSFNSSKKRKVAMIFGGQNSDGMAAMHKLNREKLLREGYDIIAPDRLGYGRSKEKTGFNCIDNNSHLSELYNLVMIDEGNCKKTAEAVNDFADNELKATEKIVCAYSLGAVDAMHSVKIDPQKTTKLVLDSPMPGKSESAKSIGDFVSNTLYGDDTFKSDTNLGNCAQFVSKFFAPGNSMSPETIFKGMSEESRRELSKIQVKIITGDEKSDMFSDNVTGVSKRLKNCGFEKVTTTICPGTHHSENGLYNDGKEAETPGKIS